MRAEEPSTTSRSSERDRRSFELTARRLDSYRRSLKLGAEEL
jgi:hypothetical protein